ncbi:MFS transporter [Cytophagaceae bacterium YF14B1]|uniref:MFS transporter n=1 Tax=Xanthocytophaga flava TaxID=3048013 RepID=A0AAE3QMR0_9BACT|nr:MFS transporter [Xanthocytophaga flavus]MDJ1481506.1 MFS transporter [Xanthocytophaga flavus]
MINRKNIILIVASTAIFFEALDIAILNLAMPLIKTEFGVANETIQWLQTIYLLFYGGFLVVGGTLSDVMGRKRIFLAGSTLFLITSLGAGLAPSFFWLMGFRALQGLAAAMAMPSAMSIITNTFTETHERNKALGVFSSFAAIGSGCGLSLGGLIATYFGWQWIFFINVPVIAIALYMAYQYIDNDQVTDDKNKPDILSGVLLTLIIVALSYVVHDLADIQDNFISTGIMLLLISGSFWLFVYRSKRQTTPLIEFSLFQHRITILGNGTCLLLGAFFSGYLFLLSLILQQNMHFSAAKSGLLLVPFSIVSSLISKFLLPVLLKKMNIVQIGILGMTLMLTGASLLLTVFWLDYNLFVLLASVACVTGSGMAICFPSLTAMAIQKIPNEKQGVGSSISTTAYFMGAGLGLSILALCMQIGHAEGKVTPLPVSVLIIYALIAIAWMWIYQRQLQMQSQLLYNH